MTFREVFSIVVDHGVIAFGKTADKGVGMRIFARFDNFIDGGVHADIADVVGDGVGEEMSVLCHHGNRSAQRF